MGDITGDETHNRTELLNYKDKPLRGFSSLLHHHSSTSTLYDRTDDYISRSSKGKKIEQETLRGTVCSLIFRVISGDCSLPTCDLMPTETTKHTFLSLPLPSWDATRRSILDPLHRTRSWSSFTTVIDLTVSFED